MIIAHRGASKYAPENTIAAFQLAYDLGATMIECDIALTADDEPIIIHDDTLNRTSNGRGAIGLYNWAYVRELDAGSWFSHQYQGARIPHLDEVINWLQRHPCRMNFELKTVPVQKIPMMVHQTLECFKQWPFTENLLISSFQFELLEAFHLQAPQIQIAGLSMKCQPQIIQAARDLGCTQLSISRDACTKECVNLIHEAGMKVGVFTVNQSYLFQKFKDWGVDAIFTDDLKMIISEKSRM